MHDLQKEKNLPDLENESIYSIGVETNSTITARTEERITIGPTGRQ